MARRQQHVVTEDCSYTAKPHLATATRRIIGILRQPPPTLPSLQKYMLSHGCVLSSTPTGQRATSFDLAEQGLGIWTESCWWCGVVSTEPVLRAGHPHPPLPTTQNKGADAPYHTMCSYTNPPWSSRWTVWTGESGMEVGSNVTCEWSPCGSSCRHGVSS